MTASGEEVVAKAVAIEEEKRWVLAEQCHAAGMLQERQQQQGIWGAWTKQWLKLGTTSLLAHLLLVNVVRHLLTTQIWLDAYADSLPRRRRVRGRKKEEKSQNNETNDTYFAS